MPRGNPQNLIPNPQRSPEELSAMGKKGGAASGITRRKQAKMSQIYQEILSGEYEIERADGTREKITGEALVKYVAGDIIKRKDSASVAMMKEMRDGTEGSKVTVEATGRLKLVDYMEEEDVESVKEYLIDDSEKSE